MSNRRKLPRSGAEDGEGGEGGVGWQRQALEKATRENAERRGRVESLRAAVQHLSARVASTREETAELAAELESCRRQLEEVKENHERELGEVAEEMREAVRFSDKEWREHCAGVEAEGRRLRGVVKCATSNALALLLQVEEAARCRLQDEEALTRPPPTQVVMYRYFVDISRAVEASGSEEEIEASTEQQLQWLYRALGCTHEEMQYKFLVKGFTAGHEFCDDDSAPARDLWELYLALCDVGFPTDAAIIKLLKVAKNVSGLSFNAVGHDPDFEEFGHAISPTAAYDFFDRLLRHLPNLHHLELSHLAPLSSPGALESLMAEAKTLWYLTLAHTDYTVANLRALRARLVKVTVHTSHCTDWGKYADIDDMEERKRRVGEACGWIARWLKDD